MVIHAARDQQLLSQTLIFCKWKSIQLMYEMTQRKNAHRLTALSAYCFFLWPYERETKPIVRVLLFGGNCFRKQIPSRSFFCQVYNCLLFKNSVVREVRTRTFSLIE